MTIMMNCESHSHKAAMVMKAEPPFFLFGLASRFIFLTFLTHIPLLSLIFQRSNKDDARKRGIKRGEKTPREMSEAGSSSPSSFARRIVRIIPKHLLPRQS